MSASPFAEAIRAVHAPLAFASRDDAAAGRVRDLEASVTAACERALALAIPEEARERLERVRARFAAPLDVASRGEAVAAALLELGPLREPDFAIRALARPLASLPGIGPKRADTLARRGLHFLGDLLFQLPSRYDDRRTRTVIGALEVGRRVTFEGDVLLADFVPIRGRRGFHKSFQAVVGDETGTVQLKWFRGGETIARSVKKGARVQVTGDVRRYRFQRELMHPDVEVLRAPDDEASSDVASPSGLPVIVAEYPAFEGIPPRTVRRLMATAIESAADLVAGHLPERVVADRGLPGLADALRAIHLPPDDADVLALHAFSTPAHERLILEELYLLEVGMRLRRAERARVKGIAVQGADAADAATRAALPFTLTDAQVHAWEQIRADLARPHPMQRLLQGDVGSGKTAVAFLAAHAVARAGLQAALMAPTELLAEQHLRTLAGLAESTATAGPLRLALLSSSLPRAEAQAVRAQLVAGEIDLVIGTHALVQDEVRFARLALAIVDEQHRFGVLQRASLGTKGPGAHAPHLLVMTATPIPRTLALTVYADLDLSVIDALPPGRVPVETQLLRDGEGARVSEAIREALDRGERVYVVYPLVEESEKIDLRAATESFDRIQRAFDDVRVELVHGRLDARERAAAMARFEAGESRILVSTTVIEVGVDVPAATLMVVEHAERFGLAQLHQLRGRVGRGERPGRCLLVARGSSEDSEARLRAMLETTDGFRIADADLRIRGPGDFLGTRQSGRLPDLRFANLLRDARWVAVAKEAATRTVERDPRLEKHPELARVVQERWGTRLALAEVG